AVVQHGDTLVDGEPAGRYVGGSIDVRDHHSGKVEDLGRHSEQGQLLGGHPSRFVIVIDNPVEHGVAAVEVEVGVLVERQAPWDPPRRSPSLDRLAGNRPWSQTSASLMAENAVFEDRCHIVDGGDVVELGDLISPHAGSWAMLSSWERLKVSLTTPKRGSRPSKGRRT